MTPEQEERQLKILENIYRSISTGLMGVCLLLYFIMLSTCAMKH